VSGTAKVWLSLSEKEGKTQENSPNHQPPDLSQLSTTILAMINPNRMKVNCNHIQYIDHYNSTRPP